MIKVRQRTDTKEPGWQVDIKAMPLGAFRAKRYRYTAPRSINTKSAALRWGEQVRREIEAGKPARQSREGKALAVGAVDLERRTLRVERSVSPTGEVTTPKNGKARMLSMTGRLTAALVPFVHGRRKRAPLFVGGSEGRTNCSAVIHPCAGIEHTSGPCADEREGRVAKALPKRCQIPGRNGPRWANVGRAQSRRNARLPGIAADLLVRGRRGGLGRTVLARNTAKHGGSAGG